MDLRGSSRRIKRTSKWLFRSRVTADTDVVIDHRTSSEKVSERAHFKARNCREICSVRPHLPNDQLWITIDLNNLLQFNLNIEHPRHKRNNKIKVTLSKYSKHELLEVGFENEKKLRTNLWASKRYLHTVIHILFLNFWNPPYAKIN